MGLCSAEFSSNALWWEVRQLIFVGHCLNVDTINNCLRTSNTNSTSISWNQNRDRAGLQRFRFFDPFSLCSSVLRWDGIVMIYRTAIFVFFFPQKITHSHNVGKKTPWTSPHLNHENEKLLYSFPVKSKLKMPIEKIYVLGLILQLNTLQTKSQIF